MSFAYGPVAPLPSAYVMLKGMPPVSVWCVDDDPAEYVPDVEQGSWRCLQSEDEAVLTQRSLLPVSSCREKGWGGVPIVTLM